MNNYIPNVFRSNNGYIGNNIYIYIYKKYDNTTFDKTENVTKHINNYSNDVTNNYKMHKINNVKKTY